MGDNIREGEQCHLWTAQKQNDKVYRYIADRYRPLVLRLLLCRLLIAQKQDDALQAKADDARRVVLR